MPPASATDSYEQRFAATFGEGRGLPVSDSETAAAPLHNHSTYSSVDGIAPASALEELCSGCGNVPYEDQNGWHGHDEDCDRLGEAGDLLPSHCSDCEELIVFSAGRWAGHRPTCSQLSSAPDICLDMM